MGPTAENDSEAIIRPTWENIIHSYYDQVPKRHGIGLEQRMMLPTQTLLINMPSPIRQYSTYSHFSKFVQLSSPQVINSIITRCLE